MYCFLASIELSLHQAASESCKMFYLFHCNFKCARSVIAGFIQLLNSTDLANDKPLILAHI